MTEEEATKAIRSLYWAAVNGMKQMQSRGTISKTTRKAELQAAVRLHNALTGNKRKFTDEEADNLLGW